ncbi:MAG TPA: hypothetical protein VFJ97_17045 [Dermatophilaceae bacterium]|nr:hypothetical protein [Dermatophilaceae bacterium]
MRKRAIVSIAVPLLFAGVPVAAAAAGGNEVCNNGPWSGPAGVKGAVAGCTFRVSVTSSDTDPGGTSQRPRISEDGNFVVFQSGADNLVTPYEPGHGTHVYWTRVDTAAVSIQMIDLAADGGAPNSTSTQGATFVDVSPDGRFAAFYSTATNLVAGKTTRLGGNLFVRDMFAAGVRTIEVPRSPSGKDVNGYSTRPTIGLAANGMYYIAYNSKGTNLVTGAALANEAYVTELDPATFTVSLPKLLSHVPNQPTSPANGTKNEHAEISSDGSAIAFQSDATNLSPKANAKTQVYLTDNPFLAPGADPVLVSVSDTGAVANQPSTRPAINRNGDEVGFQTTADNLVPGDTNLALDVFVRGTGPAAFIAEGHTERVSLSYLGDQLSGASQRINLSGDGSKVAFAANSAQTVKGDRNKARDVTLRDLRTGKNYLIDVCVAGTTQNGGFGGMTPPCSTSTATAAASTSTASSTGSAPAGGLTSSARAGATDLSSRAFLSDDGTRVAFISGMDDLVPNDTNDATSLDDIFVRQFNAF